MYVQLMYYLSMYYLSMSIPLMRMQSLYVVINLFPEPWIQSGVLCVTFCPNSPFFCTFCRTAAVSDPSFKWLLAILTNFEVFVSGGTKVAWLTDTLFWFLFWSMVTEFGATMILNGLPVRDIHYLYNSVPIRSAEEVVIDELSGYTYWLSNIGYEDRKPSYLGCFGNAFAPILPACTCLFRLLVYDVSIGHLMNAGM